MNNLLCFGMGFCAQTLAQRLNPALWSVRGTARTTEGVARLREQGFEAVRFADALKEPARLQSPLFVLVSAPPSDGRDPVLATFETELTGLSRNISWIGYLSTTGVYGDHQGNWVDEDSPLSPRSERAKRRVDAEGAWLAWGARSNVLVSIFRLAGIYGPGRNQLKTLRERTARRIVKPGQVFSRIHVDDVAAVLEASMLHPPPGRIYNVCDDEPCAPHVVIEYAAQLLGVAAPPLEQFETARSTLSPMAASFYDESKRVRNDRMKQELNVCLQYPTYREGLRALQAADNRVEYS
ncbi:MAG: SDR family oxidoreductase [Micropepsaceae bacterium]